MRHGKADLHACTAMQRHTTCRFSRMVLRPVPVVIAAGAGKVDRNTSQFLEGQRLHFKCIYVTVEGFSHSLFEMAEKVISDKTGGSQLYTDHATAFSQYVRYQDGNE